MVRTSLAVAAIMGSLAKSGEELDARRQAANATALRLEQLERTDRQLVSVGRGTRPEHRQRVMRRLATSVPAWLAVCGPTCSDRQR